MEIKPSQVAVMIDRVEQLMTRTGNIEAGINDLKVKFAKFEDMPSRVHDLELKAEAYGRLLDRHNFILKVCGTLLISCIALLSWGWKEGKALYNADTAADRRLILVEYKLGIPHSVAEGDKQ